jgi:hypothetical protein
MADARARQDSGYKETYTEKVVVLEDIVNDTDTPLLSKAYELKEKSATVGCASARQSGDFSGELNQQFTVLTGTWGLQKQPAKRRDWEQWQRNGGMMTGTATHLQNEIQPGWGMVRFLRLWRLTCREERSIGEGRRRKSGWREIVRTGHSSGTWLYHAYSQRFDPTQAKLITFRSPTDETVVGKRFQRRGANATETDELSFEGDRFAWVHDGRTDSGTFVYDQTCGRIVATTDLGTVYKAVHDRSFGSVCWDGKSYRLQRTATRYLDTTIKAL